MICIDGKIKHGGLVDRFKGIISFYQIAKKMGYQFKIQYTHPFQLTDFVVPNDVDWVEKNNTKWNPFTDKIFYFIDRFDANPMEILEKTNWTKALIYSNIDYTYKISELNNEEGHRQLWKTSFFSLFKKSDALSKAIAEKNIPNNKIAVHARFTSLLGDFEDVKTKTLSKERTTELLEKCRTAISEIIKTNPGLPVYVFSDSITFLNYIQTVLKVEIPKGIPKHTDRSVGNYGVSDGLNTMLDFFSIAESDKIIRLKFDGMYASEFSKYASYIGNSEFIKYEYLPS